MRRNDEWCTDSQEGTVSVWLHRVVNNFGFLQWRDNWLLPLQPPLPSESTYLNHNFFIKDYQRLGPLNRRIFLDWCIMFGCSARALGEFSLLLEQLDCCLVTLWQQALVLETTSLLSGLDCLRLLILTIPRLQNCGRCVHRNLFSYNVSKYHLLPMLANLTYGIPIVSLQLRAFQS